MDIIKKDFRYVHINDDNDGILLMLQVALNPDFFLDHNNC